MEKNWCQARIPPIPGCRFFECLVFGIEAILA
jgi:hypothetical protein